MFPFLDLDFLLCCSYTCCYTTYANTCWRLAGEFPTFRVSVFSRRMRNVHRGLCPVYWSLMLALFCLGSYIGPVPGLSAAGLHPMDVKPGSSSGLHVCILLSVACGYLHLFFSHSKSYSLLNCSMLRCFHHQHVQSDVLRIATLHNLSSTNSELQR